MGKHIMVNAITSYCCSNLPIRYDDFITIANKASAIKAAISKRRFLVIVSNMEHGHTNFVMMLQ